MTLFSVGVDVGATSTKIGLVRAPDVLVDHRSVPSQLKGDDPGPWMAQVSKLIGAYAGEHALAGIGVALCSLVNAEHTGALLSVNAPALNHFNIQAALRERFGCPVTVGNDVAAYARAEWALGAGRGARRMLCLALGTGLAIACLIDGRLVETWGGVPADAGRIILQPGADYACAAGVRGSAESLIGTAAIERRARAIYGRAVTAHEVIETARDGAGEHPASQVMREVGRDVGHLLALLSPVFFPQRIVITGGTAEAGDRFFQAVRARHAELIGAFMANLSALEGGGPRPVEIVKGALGPEAAVLGAAIPFFDDHR